MIEFDCLEEWRILTILIRNCSLVLKCCNNSNTWLDVLQHLKWISWTTFRILRSSFMSRFNYCRQVVQIKMLRCVRLSSETIWTITFFFITLHLTIDHSLLSRDQGERVFPYFLFSESVSYEFGGRGGVITYNYPRDKQPDTKVIITNYAFSL